MIPPFDCLASATFDRCSRCHDRYLMSVVHNIDQFGIFHDVVAKEDISKRGDLADRVLEEILPEEHLLLRAQVAPQVLFLPTTSKPKSIEIP